MYEFKYVNKIIYLSFLAHNTEIGVSKIPYLCVYTQVDFVSQELFLIPWAQPVFRF